MQKQAVVIIIINLISNQENLLQNPGLIDLSLFRDFMFTLTLLTVLLASWGWQWAVEKQKRKGLRQVTEVMLCCRWDEACLCDGNYMHEEVWSDRMCLVMTTRHLSDDEEKKSILLFFGFLNPYERLDFIVCNFYYHVLLILFFFSFFNLCPALLLWIEQSRPTNRSRQPNSCKMRNVLIK